MRVLNYSPVQTTNSGRSWGRADSALSSILAATSPGLRGPTLCRPGGLLGQWWGGSSFRLGGLRWVIRVFLVRARCRRSLG